MRDELLAEEGYRRGYEYRPSVRYDVGMWRDHFLYTMGKNRMIEGGIDIGRQISSMKKSFGVIVDEEKLDSLEITAIPMIAVWTDFKRQLIVPRWPQLDLTLH